MTESGLMTKCYFCRKPMRKRGNVMGRTWDRRIVKVHRKCLKEWKR